MSQATHQASVSEGSATVLTLEALSEPRAELGGAVKKASTGKLAEGVYAAVEKIQLVL